jgi:predicted nuclease of predicted toxin-antitoxin system
MKLVIDMNLPPEWVPLLHNHGFEAVHWSTLGAGDASDREILRWARSVRHSRAALSRGIPMGLS